VGNFDTYPSGQGGGSSGCWGVYHNFPSGTIIASNIDVGGAGELWLLTPNYVRACYLEGKITDGITGANLSGAQIQVVGTNPLLSEISALNGLYKTGQEAEGYYKVRVSKTGYQDFETSIYFQHGELILLDVALFPNTGSIDLTGTVIQHSDGQPVANVTVWLYGATAPISQVTDGIGLFNFNNIKAGIYNISAGAPGLGMGMLSGQTIVGNTDVTIELFATHRKDAVNTFGAEELWAFAQNPFRTETSVRYHLEATNASITFLNELGQAVHIAELSGTEGQISFGAGLPAGMYFAVLKQDGIVLEVKKLIKG
jgi:hypothetical protein